LCGPSVFICCGTPCSSSSSSGSGAGSGSSSGSACSPEASDCQCSCDPNGWSCDYPCSDSSEPPSVCTSTTPPQEGQPCANGVTCQVIADAGCTPPRCTCPNGVWSCEASPCGVSFPGVDAGKCPAIPAWGTCSPDGTTCVYPGTTCHCVGSGWACDYSDGAAE
jgi:hypothetical protein